MMVLIALLTITLFIFWPDGEEGNTSAVDPGDGDPGDRTTLALGNGPDADLPPLRSPLSENKQELVEDLEPTPTLGEVVERRAEQQGSDDPPTGDASDDAEQVTQSDPITRVIEQTREAVPPPRPPSSSADAMTLYNKADQLLAAGDRVGGRALLSQVLFADNIDLSAEDAMHIRNQLTELNQELVFSKEIAADDPIADRHMVQPGEYLASIGVRYKVPYQMLEMVNGIKARQLQADRPIKVIRGPIHARVIKHQYLMDLFAVGSDGLPVYVCSFRVGLGKDDKTPVGDWALTKGEKVVNPDWRDELTNEYFASNDPDNPIGEYWMAMHGTDENTKNKTGFGIHGTIEPESIGTQASRGCIRLGDEDIELAFYMLTELGSTVRIEP
jgi:LysM repeat protein